MTIPRMHIEDTALLVIDMQEKLVPTIIDRQRLITNCSVMIAAAGELELPYLVTEHYPAGLGRTVQEITSAMVDPSARVEKTRFSALVDLVDERLRRWRRSNVLVCGIEAHVCVLQTVLDLQGSGRQCFLVSDAIASSQTEQLNHAVRRMEAGGAVTTGVIGAMYELLGDAAHPARRTFVELAKKVAR